MNSAMGIASEGITLSLMPPGKSSTGITPFLTVSLDDALPGWRLGLNLNGSDPFSAASSRRTTIYLWTGILVSASIALLALLLAVYLRRQIRLTRLKNDLIATVSHELKTPLSSIRVLVDTLLDGQHQNSRQVSDYLQLIAKENSRLGNLIDNFLTFSRLERGKFTVEMSTIKVEEIINAAVETLGDRLQAPGCTLKVELAISLSPVRGDHESLVTVLVNLLDNALKYTGPSKNITLRSYSANGDICLEVSDDGIGFSHRAAKRIFDRFYQVDRSLTRRVGGCGLGLSIVKSIVAAHGGAVTAQSQLEHFHRPPSGRLTGLVLMSDEAILIIEDDPAMLRGLKDNFAFHGYRVKTAMDGEEGLEAAVNTRPDLIVLDIMLPKINGYEIAA